MNRLKKTHGNLMKAYLGLVLCVGLMGCSFKKDDPPKVKSAEEIAREVVEQQEEKIISSKMQVDQFRINIIPMAKANEYQLAVEWDKQNAKVEFISEITPTRVLRETATESPFFFPLVGGDKFKLNIRAVTLRDVVIFDGSVNVEVPKDYVISGSFRLSEDLIIQAPRVFIRANSVIRTLQYKLNIFTGNLVIEDSATLENFRIDDFAPYLTSGQNGGTVVVKSGKASGKLIIRPRGQAGGRGMDAAQIKKEVGQDRDCRLAIGKKGGAGGTILFDIADDSKFSPVFFESQSAGGSRGVPNYSYESDGKTVEVPDPYCKDIQREVGSYGPSGASGTVCFISTSSHHQGCLKPIIEEPFNF